MTVPTQLKLIRGNPGKRKIRPEPEPASIDTSISAPEPPEFLMEYAKEEWRRLICEMDRLRLVTVVDVQAFAAYCQSYGRWRTAEEKLAVLIANDPSGGFLIRGPKGAAPMHNPMMRAAIRAAKDMLYHASDFGLTPLARARIAAGAYDDSRPGKFDRFIAS